MLGADTVSYGNLPDFSTYSGVLFAPEGATTTAFGFPQFDPTLGQLNSVTYDWALSANGLLAYYSFSPGPTAFDDSVVVGTGSVGDAVGSSQETYQGNFYWPGPYGGCQCYVPFSFGLGGTDSVSNINPYIGTGNIGLFSTFNLSGFDEPDSEVLLGSIVGFGAIGTVNWSGTVTYDYTPFSSVPEPRSLIVLSVLVGAVVAVHRLRFNIG